MNYSLPAVLFFIVKWRSVGTHPFHSIGHGQLGSLVSEGC